MARIPDGKRHLSVIIDEGVVERIQILAGKERRAWNAQIQIVLEEGLAAINAKQDRAGNATTA